MNWFKKASQLDFTSLGLTPREAADYRAYLRLRSIDHSEIAFANWSRRKRRNHDEILRTKLRNNR